MNFKTRELLDCVWCRLCDRTLRLFYGLQAAGKAVGGVQFQYTARGDGHEDQQRAIPTSAAMQRGCLAQLLLSLSPTELVLPEPLRQAALPVAYGQTVRT